MNQKENHPAPHGKNQACSPGNPTGKKEQISKESFWKEALKSDSLLWWITFNLGHFREERT